MSVKPLADLDVFATSCDHCGKNFSYCPDSVYTREFGCAFVNCPHCGERNEETKSGIIKHLVASNVNYPQDYFDGSHSANDYNDSRLPSSNEEIDKIVRESINRLAQNPKMGVSVSGCGSLIIIVIDMIDDYRVYISSNYKTTSVNNYQ